MQRQQGGDVRMRPEVAGLPRAVEVAAPLRASLVDAAAPGIVEVRTAIIHERQDGAVVERHAPMAGAAGALAFNARQVYHGRQPVSAEVDGRQFDESGVVARRYSMRGAYAIRAPRGSAEGGCETADLDRETTSPRADWIRTSSRSPARIRDSARP